MRSLPLGMVRRRNRRSVCRPRGLCTEFSLSGQFLLVFHDMKRVSIQLFLMWLDIRSFSISWFRLGRRFGYLLAYHFNTKHLGTKKYSWYVEALTARKALYFIDWQVGSTWQPE